MWIFSNEETSYFLRPGQNYTVGRRGAIQAFHKSVSKEHAELSVAQSDPSSALVITSSPRLTVRDVSKAGMSVNSRRLHNAADDIQSPSTLRFGLDPTIWTVEFRPMVITVSMGPKTTDPSSKLRRYADKIGNLGFKFSHEFIPTTKVVVSAKRNTAKSLQALITGVSIVTDTYINHLSENYQSFDGINLPDASLFLPSDTEHPRELFKRDARRGSVFNGLVFIFVNELQYRNLAPPIQTGEGKAILTSESEVAKYGSGHGSNEFVLVLPLEDQVKWRRIASELGFKAVMQNQFLDIILTLDRSILAREYLEPVTADDDRSETLGESSKSNAASNTLRKKNSQPLSVSKSSENVPESNTRKRGRVISPTQDAGSEESPSDAQPAKRPRRQPTRSTIMDDLFSFEPASASRNKCEELHTDASETQNAHTYNDSIDKRKRKTSPEPVTREISSEPEAVRFSGMEMAKRRQEQTDFSQTSNRSERAEEIGESTPAQTAPLLRKNKKSKEEAERCTGDENLMQKEDKVQEESEVFDYSHLKNLGQVVTFVPQRRKPTEPKHNEDLNGRKNFKGFIRNGNRRSVRGAPTFIGFVKADSNHFRIPADAIGDLRISRSNRSNELHVARNQADRSIVRNEGNDSEEENLRFSFD